MNEPMIWAGVTYLGLLVLAVLFFKAGARYDEQSEQLSAWSMDHLATESAEAIIGHPTAEDA
jgi:hypothetical protein